MLLSPGMWSLDQTDFRNIQLILRLLNECLYLYSRLDHFTSRNPNKIISKEI